MGKTTYMMRFIEHAPYDHLFVFDHKLEFLQRLNFQPCYNLEECSEKLKKGEKVISYHHSVEDAGESEECFQEFCSWTYEMCKILHAEKGQSLFVGDEVNRFTGTSGLGDGFGVLIEDGRLHGLDFIGTSHASNQISNRLRLQLSEIVTFRLRDERPLKFLEEAGFDVDEIPHLDKGEFIQYDCDADTYSRAHLFKATETENDKKDLTPEENKSTGGEEQEKTSSETLQENPSCSSTNASNF